MNLLNRRLTVAKRLFGLTLSEQVRDLQATTDQGAIDASPDGYQGYTAGRSNTKHCVNKPRLYNAPQ